MAAAAAAAATLLMDELVEEILLRFPPDDPARLLDAALVCKRWCRLVTGRAFRRRFRELHRTPPLLCFLVSIPETPPLLGFISSIPDADGSYVARFVPTSSFRPSGADHTDWWPLHSGHGRVLLCSAPWVNGGLKKRLLVWDPITDDKRVLPTPSCLAFPVTSCSAAVLCAATEGGRCTHLDCHRGPFRVVFVRIMCEVIIASVYSSEADAWSEPIFKREPDGYLRLETRAQAFVGNALYMNYYKFDQLFNLLKYDFTTGEISVIHLPAEVSERHILPMAMEDGSLGFATVDESKLYLWSREVGPNEDARWVQCRVIGLGTLLPIHAFSVTPEVVGVADGAGVIVMWTCAGVFSLDLKSEHIKKLGLGGDGHGFRDSVSFMSFCTPELRAAHTGDGSGAGA